MSYSQYDQYGGNPHGGSVPGSVPGYDDPYAQGGSTELRNMSAAPPVQTTQGGTYVQPRTQREFLDQVAVIRDLLRGFDTSMAEISKFHQHLLDATDTASAAELGPGLQQLESETLSRNDQLKRLIKNLEQDAANTADDTQNMKYTQIGPLKKEFQSKLTKYQGVERDYRTRRQEQIRRQYLIVNPDATDTELAAVADTSNDPGSQNVFQMALTNRRGQAQSALGAVKARHDELQRIERTITELATLFNEMDQLVVAQDSMEQENQLPQVPNFRDVGKTVNQFLGERRIREGLFYRSGRLDDATAADKSHIRDELEIKTVIDLRTKTEILKQIKKHQLEYGHSSASSLQIQGLNYHGIKINGKSFERHLLSLLSWWDFFKVIFFFVLGYRIDAVRVLSHQVMLPRGLVGLGLDTLDYCGSEIREALSLYTTPQSLPSVVHCTQGKDRTGLICALVLMILNIPRAAIEHDYFLTDAALVPSRPQMLVEIHEIGLTDEWAGTASDMISSIESHIKARYGNLDGYLDSIGFGQDQRAMIQQTLLY